MPPGGRLPAPVLSVIPYTDEDRRSIANSTIYGLSGAVFGEQEHALAIARRLRTGKVDINGAQFNVLTPFGGYKQSGNGREMGRFGLEEFLEIKSIGRWTAAFEPSATVPATGHSASVHVMVAGYRVRTEPGRLPRPVHRAGLPAVCRRRRNRRVRATRRPGRGAR